MLKIILAIVVGLAVAIGTTSLTDLLFHATMPATPMPADPAARQAWVSAQPASAFAIILAGWAFAAFSGAAVAARVAGRVAWPGLVVTGVYFLAVIANLVLLSHPRAFVIAGVVAVPLVGWLGARLASAGGRGARTVG